MHASAAASQGDAGTVIAIVFAIVAGVAAYWVPAAVAWIRHVPNAGSVTVVNGFLGWTVIGWVVALAMACRSRSVPVTYAQPPPPGPGSWHP